MVAVCFEISVATEGDGIFRMGSHANGRVIFSILADGGAKELAWCEVGEAQMPALADFVEMFLRVRGLRKGSEDE